MFSCEFFSAKVFKDLIFVCQNLLEQVLMDFTTEGIAIQGMDASLVSLARFKMKVEGFHKYDCKQEMTIGLNLINLHHIMKFAQKDDKLQEILAS